MAASLRIHDCVESARAAFGCPYRHCTAQPIKIDPHIMPIFCIDMIPRECGKLVVAHPNSLENYKTRKCLLVQYLKA